VPTMACIDRSLPAQLLPCSRGGGGTEENIKSATEVTPSSEVITGRKRRGSDAHIRHVLDGTVVIATAPIRRVSGRSKRASYQTPRRRKLSPEQEAAIRANAGNHSLRELAAEFGVSHETIRTVRRQEPPVTTKMR
jgi:DNA-binding NarL/FixJ family response regulator